MEMNAKGKGEVMSVPELASWLGMKPRWAWKHVPTKRIPGMFYVGRNVRFERAAIEKHRLATGQILLPKGNR